MSYAELYCQSNFSFLTGASHPEELVIKAEQLGYQALAITDECSVAGVVRAYSAIQEHALNIELIIGASFCFQDDLRFVLLCPNRQAYAELCRVITNARRRCKKGHYELTTWDLHSIKHCYVLWLPTGNDAIDSEHVELLIRYYPRRLFIGYTHHLQGQGHRFLMYCEQLATTHNIDLVACGGVLMHDKQRQPLQDVLHAIRHNKRLIDMGKLLQPNAERCLKSIKVLTKLFPDYLIENTLRIASKCQFSLASLQYEYPAEVVPSTLTATQYLSKLVSEGARMRFPDGVPKSIQAIIDKELVLIAEQGYEYFFLTIYDIVQYAKEQGILYQGRGSAANSVVCYCLEITAVDPQQISVLFERFISKERNEPPDIDVDFEHQRREEIFQYIYQKYGRNRAALAATVITYRLKSAIRDVGKVLGFNETQLSFFIKNMNRRDRGLDWRTQLIGLGLSANSRQGQLFIQLVDAIMGFPRHLSQHVGGFVISAGPLYELVPVENAAMDERTVIQWDKNDLQTLGLLKVDVLALGMLSAIKHAFSYIKTHYPLALSIADITALPEDPQVYKMLQQADTVGVFQIESRAQMSMLPRLKPYCYYDLVVQIAIVRPGPIQGDMVHPYLRRRAGLEPIEYPSASVEAVLKRTLGVPIFQEQVIKLAMVAAGFSGGEADQLRRAMAKWQRNGKLHQFKDKLIHGMQSRGYSHEYAERIFQQICGFGEYGFPESHSASFAVLAYVSAWLKYYFPAAFYSALLNSYPMGFYSPSQLIQDAQRHNVEVRGVDINLSLITHQMVLCDDTNTYAIQLGLSIIKGLSNEGATTLINNRPKKGFQHIAELQALNLRTSDLAVLASANALTCFANNRFFARWLLLDKREELPLWQSATATESIATQQSFNFVPDAIDDVIEDYAATGLSVNHHPISLLTQQGLLGRYNTAQSLASLSDKSVVNVIGLVTGKQSPGTAGGVTFFTLEDHTGNVNVVVWQATARAQQKSYLTAKILKVTGIVEKEGDVIHVIAGKLIDYTKYMRELATKSRNFH